MNAVISTIQNVELLTDVLGQFPSFHDAEVLSVELDRPGGKESPSLCATIYVFEMTSETDETGNFILKNQVQTRIRFSAIRDLKIEDFNHQNVLSELIIERLTDNLRFEVEFRGIYGIQASFQCDAIKVESVEPYHS